MKKKKIKDRTKRTKRAYHEGLEPKRQQDWQAGVRVALRTGFKSMHPKATNAKIRRFMKEIENQIHDLRLLMREWDDMMKRQPRRVRKAS